MSYYYYYYKNGFDLPDIDSKGEKNLIFVKLGKVP